MDVYQNIDRGRCLNQNIIYKITYIYIYTDYETLNTTDLIQKTAEVCGDPRLPASCLGVPVQKFQLCRGQLTDAEAQIRVKTC